MKITSLILAFLLLAISANAQEESSKNPQRNYQQNNTLFGNHNKIKSGYWGGISMGYGQLMSEDMFIFGIRGGWMIDQSITFGIQGKGFFSNYEGDILDNREDWRALSGTYGGLLIEPVLIASSPIHLTLPITIGAGAVFSHNNCHNYYTGYDGALHYYSYQDTKQAAFFAFEPGAELELNLVKFMRIGFGASYLFASDIHIEGFEEDAMCGWSAQMSLKFGKF